MSTRSAKTKSKEKREQEKPNASPLKTHNKKKTSRRAEKEEEEEQQNGHFEMFQEQATPDFYDDTTDVEDSDRKNAKNFDKDGDAEMEQADHQEKRKEEKADEQERSHDDENGVTRNVDTDEDMGASDAMAAEHDLAIKNVPGSRQNDNEREINSQHDRDEDPMRNIMEKDQFGRNKFAVEWMKEYNQLDTLTDQMWKMMPDIFWPNFDYKLLQVDPTQLFKVENVFAERNARKAQKASTTKKRKREDDNDGMDVLLILRSVSLDPDLYWSLTFLTPIMTVQTSILGSGTWKSGHTYLERRAKGWISADQDKKFWHDDPRKAEWQLTVSAAAWDPRYSDENKQDPRVLRFFAFLRDLQEAYVRCITEGNCDTRILQAASSTIRKRVTARHDDVRDEKKRAQLKHDEWQRYKSDTNRFKNDLINEIMNSHVTSMVKMKKKTKADSKSSNAFANATASGHGSNSGSSAMRMAMDDAAEDGESADFLPHTEYWAVSRPMFRRGNKTDALNPPTEFMSSLHRKLFEGPDKLILDPYHVIDLVYVNEAARKAKEARDADSSSSSSASPGDSKALVHVPKAELTKPDAFTVPFKDVSIWQGDRVALEVETNKCFDWSPAGTMGFRVHFKTIILHSRAPFKKDDMDNNNSFKFVPKQQRPRVFRPMEVDGVGETEFVQAGDYVRDSPYALPADWNEEEMLQDLETFEAARAKKLTEKKRDLDQPRSLMPPPPGLDHSAMDTSEDNASSAATAEPVAKFSGKNIKPAQTNAYGLANTSKESLFRGPSASSSSNSSSTSVKNESTIAREAATARDAMPPPHARPEKRAKTEK